MTRQLGLVAASRQQRRAICRATDQFDPSPVFRRARAYCERMLDEWYVLSPTHGLLLPQQVIGPEPTALHDLTGEAWHTWARLVASQLAQRRQRASEPLIFVLLASQRTADALQRASDATTFHLPLSGLAVGERMRWLDDQLRIRSRVLPPQPTAEWAASRATALK